MDFPECVRVALNCFHAEVFDIQLCNCKQYSTIITVKDITSHCTVFRNIL